MLPRGLNSFDSRNTEPDQQRLRPPSPVSPRLKKVSISDIESEHENIYGVFTLEHYTVMRGFIPGKGKNIRLHYTKLEPPKKVANVCIIQSYAGKTDDYLDIADYFTRQQMVVHMIGIRGLMSQQGLSTNNEMQEMFSDIECLLRCCEVQLPIFVCAFGFGCTLLTSFLVDNPHVPITGVVMVSPTLLIPQSFRSVTRSALKWASRRLFGDFLVHLPLCLDHLSKSNTHLKQVIDQGSQVQYIKLKVLEQLQNASEYMMHNAWKINYPVLLCYGLMNSFSSINLISQFFDSINSKDKTLRTFERGYHYLQQDEEKDTLKSDVVKWIMTRASRERNLKSIKIPQVIILNEFPKTRRWRRLLCVIGFLIAVWRLLSKKRVASL